MRKIVKRPEVRGMEHDPAFLEKMLGACHDPASCCSATGRSLLALHKIGECLSLDRINPRRGYVAGNVQLLALSLNTEKAGRQIAPQRAVNAMLKKLQHVTEDRLSAQSGAYEEA